MADDTRDITERLDPMPQRWTGVVQAHCSGGFVAVADYMRAMDTIDALRAEVARLTSERDGLMETLRDEMNENLRIRELAGATADENITAVMERVIRERDAATERAERAEAEAAALRADAEHEIRADGERVRRDRWEVGIRRIVALLWGNRREFEVAEVVEAVRGLVPCPHADDEALVRATLDAARAREATR